VSIFNSVHGTPGGTPTGRFCRFEPLHQSQEWLTVPFWNRLSVDHMTDAFWINRIQFSSQTGGGTLTLRGGYHRFRVRESGHRTFRLATQILHAYRMVHKINTDRLYEMHGTPGGTIRDPELKILARNSPRRACGPQESKLHGACAIAYRIMQSHGLVGSWYASRKISKVFHSCSQSNDDIYKASTISTGSIRRIVCIQP